MSANTGTSNISDSDADRLVRLNRIVEKLRAGEPEHKGDDLDVVAIVNAVAASRGHGNDFLIKLSLGVLTCMMTGAIGGSIQLYGQVKALEAVVIASKDEVRMLREEIRQWRKP